MSEKTSSECADLQNIPNSSLFELSRHSFKTNGYNVLTQLFSRSKSVDVLFSDKEEKREAYYRFRSVNFAMSENSSIVMNTAKGGDRKHLGMDRRGAKRSHFKRDESHSGSSTRSSRSIGSRERSQKNKELETDPLILQRRQKQIDYGKNSVAYDTYIEKVPKASRASFLPRTPDK